MHYSQLGYMVILGQDTKKMIESAALLELTATFYIKIR